MNCKLILGILTLTTLKEYFLSVATCPLRCACIAVTSGFNVDCNGRGFNKLPLNIPAETTNLHLYDNDIGVINENSLANLLSLRELYLYNNKLKVIPQKTFRSLIYIEIIHLANNGLGNLDEALFHNLTKLRQVHLQQNNMTELPGGIFRDLVSLEVVLKSTRKGDDILTLQETYLYENRIERLDQELVRNLYSVRELYMQKNRVASLPQTIFLNLTSIQLLDLSNNNISTLMAYQFFNLSHLRTLYLYSNAISELKAYTFVNLESLIQLDLYDNKISAIEQNSFVNIPLLSNLQLHFNDILCDCKIRWFRDWLLSRPSLGTAKAVCKGIGSYVTEISDVVFKDCEKIEIDLPKITSCNLLRSTNISCSLIGADGSSAKWYQYKNDVFYRILPGIMARNNIVLEINMCTSSDAGQYICSWNTNSAEKPVINSSSWLTINVDLGLPLHSVCDITSSVVLTCNMSFTNSTPTGWIHLNNGLTIRRLHGNIQDRVNILRIALCNYEDEGSYKCIFGGDTSGLYITNDASTLSVYGLPIVHQKDILTNPDQSKTLRIWFLSNPPQLSIEWMYNNMTLNESSQYYFSTEPSSFIIEQYGVNVERTGFLHSLKIKVLQSINVGYYTCMIKNPYGSVEEIFRVNAETDEPDDNNNDIVIIVVVCVCAFSVIALSVVLIVIWKRRKQQEYMKNNGNQTSVSHSGPVYDYIDVRDIDMTLISAGSSIGYASVTVCTDNTAYLNDENTYLSATQNEMNAVDQLTFNSDDSRYACYIYVSPQQNSSLAETIGDSSISLTNDSVSGAAITSISGGSSIGYASVAMCHDNADCMNDRNISSSSLVFEETRHFNDTSSTRLSSRNDYLRCYAESLSYAHNMSVSTQQNCNSVETRGDVTVGLSNESV